MKKVRVVIFCILFSVVTMSDFIDIGQDDSSVMSLYTSIYVVTSPSVFSRDSSAESKGNRAKTVEENYEYYKKLANKKNLTAKEVFSDEGLEQVKLKAEERVTLDDTKMGLIVANQTKIVALIPSSGKYANIMDSKERN